MPDRETQNAPAPEPLTLRLLRDTFDERGIPLRCPRRQCRRSRHCGGAARRPAAPLNADQRLPPCALHAKPESHRQVLAWTADLLAPLDESTAPGTWPADAETANHLRLALVIMEQIHTRPGPHRESERTALAAWQKTDPSPEITASLRRFWRHSGAKTGISAKQDATRSPDAPQSCGTR